MGARVCVRERESKRLRRKVKINKRVTPFHIPRHRGNGSDRMQPPGTQSCGRPASSNQQKVRQPRREQKDTHTHTHTHTHTRLYALISTHTLFSLSLSRYRHHNFTLAWAGGRQTNIDVSIATESNGKKHGQSDAFT